MKGSDRKRRPDHRRVSLAKAPRDHAHLGLCLVYSGAGFRGLQLQVHGPTCHTIEGVLLQALKDAGVIADIVRGRPEGEQHHFARSCRTDRGVHAIRNMISLFIPNEVVERAGGLEGVREKVNVHLPVTVRVAHVMLLAGNFIPRHCCNRRVYRYMLPLYALLPPCDTWAALEKYYPGCFAQLQALAEFSKAAQHTLHGVPYMNVKRLTAASTSLTRPDSAAAEAAPPARSWVHDTEEKIKLCNRILSSRFTLSRRYHNFSVDIDANRSSVSAKVVQPDTDEALRVIYRCEILPRVFFFPCATRVDSETTQPLHGASLSEYTANLHTTAADGEHDGSANSAKAAATSAVQLPAGPTTVLPFVFFQIEGGSFLLNMIRKVVGSLLAVCRGARESMLDDALNPERRVTTPLAPGPYLYLAQSTYHGYNRSLCGLQGTRLLTVQKAWAGAVDDAAEAFAFRTIAADVVDADLNALPPLDDTLAARDRALAVRRPQTAAEDAHLSEMKEYRPVLPSRTQWPTCSEMTVFLRLLRVHNWNVRPIRLDPSCKALKELRNRDGRAAAPETKQAMCTPPTSSAEGATSAQPDAAAPVLPSATEDEHGEAEVPDGGADGWLYLADSAEEAVAQRQAYFASRWKRARRWEFADADTEAGGEDDVDDDAPVAARCQRQRRG
ncbi:pseudouridylate synthase-like protein [Leptomonas pyrrhocoris]|uniref:Pseudouridylate synthase-like protein n=1 Tax=Leptomonas pyrrhocoris TaxID=157538 RepID=A0A0N0E0R6_LEPPY|nr:pseudouridylate synthase-like protein [Leptomonas pyrrhocoris]KPA86751.1 pseudouridylate synthase-like protein [Leptomonas pyrrhocoris]|eukprot:XP_015665190.1 pseudouridylate synthase-like protein [Leptomonas pyrrhocoris]